MDNNYYVKLATSMEKYIGKQRQSLVFGYASDVVDDTALTKMPAIFFAELLKNENDPVCKWYEIKAIGELRAVEYVDLLVSVLVDEDVKFESGSSLHSISASSLGKIGNTAVKSVVSAFMSANKPARLAIIDTLGETKCQAGALAIEKLIPQFSSQEFTYAMLALAKCEDEGEEILRKLYTTCDDKEKLLCVIDALCYSPNSDELLKNALYNKTDLVIKVFSAKTRGACLVLDRIKNRITPWTSEDIYFIIQNGVNISY